MTTKPGLLDRTATGFKAVKEEVFAGVPAPVVERIGSQAKVGIGLIVLGVLLAGGALYLVASSKGLDWKVLALLLIIPMFLIIIGSNMISQKVTQAAIGSIAAFVRALKGGNGQPA